MYYEIKEIILKDEWGLLEFVCGSAPTAEDVTSRMGFVSY